MTDRIVLQGLAARGTHGVFEAEKADGQMFIADVTLEVDLRPAGQSDDLARTVNYAQVAEQAVAVLAGESLDLIETVAERIAAAALEHGLVEAVEVTIHKPEAPVGVPFGDVQVGIRRERDVPVVVALGGNLGDVRATLEDAVARLEAIEGFAVQSVSPLFETDPVGGPDQPDYLNAVLLGRTRLAPHTVLRRLHEVEARHGRVRELRWGARTLDLDLIQYGDPARQTDVLMDGDELTLPHPRAHERAFVLLPWVAADPAAQLRVGGRLRPVADLLQERSADGVRPGPEWRPTW
ncbi:2-amino-4-hydroxy-6-hydroxymethyldihydropteridine diphosphokinase [Segeticoccus rhizosphaerae]|uniref:2-amino-4-hydroxy-6- hydroxymethyldihydropteridine diphosphokinase n=1 Tax=Segeticoccus rhizosphaerae TaxID=1104777 RepID=UPI0010C0291D|nr:MULTISPECIES: 2-amino-4-hydroxy-6-hydroxymethyldihydropteridine diphosphokinase [Intrasporangiaceae]